MNVDDEWDNFLEGGDNTISDDENDNESLPDLEPTDKYDNDIVPAEEFTLKPTDTILDEN